MTMDMETMIVTMMMIVIAMTITTGETVAIMAVATADEVIENEFPSASVNNAKFSN